MPVAERADEATIPIADYGGTNSGKLKKLYRVGLSHRYGSMMQTVSGIHYNFSFDDRLFEQWVIPSDRRVVIPPDIPVRRCIEALSDKDKSRTY